jgi:Family of unknown function (DUF5906)
MSASIDTVRAELIALQEAYRHPLPDGKDAVLALLSKYGCKDSDGLAAIEDPEVHEEMIATARALAESARDSAGKPPRLVPVAASILKFIKWQKGELESADKDRVYTAIAATEGIGPVEIDHLLKELRTKIPGRPSIVAVRKEFESARRLSRARKAELPKGVKLVLFHSHLEAVVYGGVYDPQTDKFLPGLGLAAQPRAEDRANLCAYVGKSPLEIDQIPKGSFEFHPGLTPQVIETSSWITVNTWTAPKLRERAQESGEVPPTVRKLLLHVLGSDEAVYSHFMNWLAVAFQTNDRTGTAWVIAGCPGTGKGLLVKEIIEPLFGFCQMKEARHLESEFNEWFAACTMLVIDEAKISGFKAPQVESALRRYITEDKITVREKFKSDVVVRNHCNLIITSNDPRPISIPEGDRRYNVAPRQETPLRGDIEAMILALRAEMPRFAGFLSSYAIDAERARKPMRTDERETTIENSTTTPERIGRAIKKGDLDFFLEEFWTSAEGLGAASGLYRDSLHVRDVILGWARAAAPAGAKRIIDTKVPAAQVALVFNFLMPEKFSRSPQEIGRALGLKATAQFGPKSNRGRAYRVAWQSKDSIDELERTVCDLSRFGSATEEEWNSDAQVMAGNDAGGTPEWDDVKS